MNRFQKKCFLASLLLHGSLLFVLIFGTAFFSAKEPPFESPNIIELMPNMTVTDGPTKGGGGSPPPAARPDPEPPVRTPEPKPVQQPAPEPKPEPRKPEPEPVKTKPDREEVSEIPVAKPKKPVVKKTVEKPKATKPAVDISKPVVRNTVDKAALAKAAEAAAKAEQDRIRKQRLSALAGARQSLQKSLSSGSPIEALGGAGGGGAAEINYRDLVFSKYDAAWVEPSDIEDDGANTKARVVIARNGNVISAQIIKASGNAKLDQSVKRTLDSLRYIHPFPEGSKDSQRTYIINFNLKSKRGIG